MTVTFSEVVLTSKWIAFRNGVQRQDVADEVFEHLVVLDEAGGEDHFGSVDIALGGAAVAGFEFGELGSEVPALEAVEGWAAEGELAAAVVTMALHAAHFEKVLSFLHVGVFECQCLGRDQWHRFDMLGDAFQLAGLKRFGDGGHHDTLRI